MNSSYGYGSSDGAAAALFGGCYSFVWLIVAVLVIAALWMIFTKAGKPGWAAIIPIYNYIVLLEVVGRPLWWVILFFIPLVNIVVMIMVMIDLAKSFGKDTGFAIGLIFLSPVFLPILGFGSAQYVGPAAGGPVGGYYPPQPPAGGYYPPQPGPTYAPPAPPAYQPPTYAPPAPAAPPAPPAPPMYAPPAPPAYAPPVPPAPPAPPAPPVAPAAEPPAPAVEEPPQE